MDHQAEEKYGLLADGEAEAQSSYTPNSQGRPTSRPRYRRSITKRRFFYSAICTFALLGLFRAFYFNFLCPSHKHTAATHKSTSISPLAANATYKVPLEAHIMSKCPDTKDCLRDLVIPAMEKIYDKVDFKLSYLGT